MQIKISLKAARVNAGLTLDDVAREIGKSKQAICAWETGKTKIKAVDLETLSALYKMPIDSIFLPI